MHVEHGRQPGPAGARRERDVPVHGQPVPRGERERLHPGQLVARQLGAAFEQEAAGAGGPVVGVVPYRAGVVGEGDQPGGVGLVPVDQARVAGVQRPDRLEVGCHRRVEHVILGPVLEHQRDLRFPGVRVQDRARHVRVGVFEQHLVLAGCAGRSGPAGRCSTPTELMASSDFPSPVNASASLAGASSAGMRQQRPPAGLGVVADEQVEPAVGQRGDRAADHHVLVREPADVPGVLDQLGQLPGLQVQPVDVVQLRVIPVHPDQDLVAVALAGGDDPRLDALVRRQVTLGHSVAVASRSTSYSRQFSSPPVSCTYIRCLPSQAQA